MIKKSSLACILPLRAKVLRPNMLLEHAIFSGDMESTTCHYTYMNNGIVAGVASLYEASCLQLEFNLKQYQIRGMAVDYKHIKCGIGSELLGFILKSLPKNSLIWCNARSSAIGFYKKMDFICHGAEFKIEGVGPHFIAYKEIQ